MKKMKLNGGSIGLMFCLFAAVGAFMQEKTMQDQEKQLAEHEKRIDELGKKLGESQQ